jgi:hypothetical protein
VGTGGNETSSAAGVVRGSASDDHEPRVWSPGVEPVGLSASQTPRTPEKTTCLAVRQSDGRASSSAAYCTCSRPSYCFWSMRGPEISLAWLTPGEEGALSIDRSPRADQEAPGEFAVEESRFSIRPGTVTGVVGPSLSH